MSDSNALVTSTNGDISGAFLSSAEPDPFIAFELRLSDYDRNATPPETTITGTGLKTSYADWTASAKGELESLSAPLANISGNGSFGFSDLEVDVIPEPSTGTLGLGWMAFAGFVRRRRVFTHAHTFSTPPCGIY